MAPADTTAPGGIDQGGGVSGWSGGNPATSYAANGFAFSPAGVIGGIAQYGGYGTGWEQNDTSGPNNGQITIGSVAKIPGSFVDGTSGTILFSETYAGNCPVGPQGWPIFWNGAAAANGLGGAFFPQSAGNIPGPGGGVGRPNPGFASALLPQWMPDQSLCNPNLLQSHQAGGILAAMADGSCRIVSDRVSQPAWQAAVYPNDNLNPTDIAGGGW
jgi:hypothetical protein